MRRLPPLVWYALVFASSSTVIHRDSFVSAVGGSLPETARPGWAGLWTGYWWVFVKGWHATEFAILLLMVNRAVRDLGWSLSLVLLAATLDELHQTFVPGRGGVVSDVLIDAEGALFAVAFLSWGHRQDADGTLEGAASKAAPRQRHYPFRCGGSDRDA